MSATPAAPSTHFLSRHRRYPGHVSRPGANTLSQMIEGVFEEDNISQDWIEELEADEETGRLLEIKRLDMVWEPMAHKYTIRDAVFTTEDRRLRSADAHKEFAFIFRQKIEDENKKRQTETLPHEGPISEIEIKSPYIKQAAREVMGKVPGFSWTASPLIVCIPPYLIQGI